MTLPTRLELELFSYVQLAKMWHRKVATIQDWVSTDRQAGHPIVGSYRFNALGQRRQFYLRGDCAWAVYQRHVGARATRPNRVKQNRRSTKGPGQ